MWHVIVNPWCALLSLLSPPSLLNTFYPKEPLIPIKCLLKNAFLDKITFAAFFVVSA